MSKKQETKLPCAKYEISVSVLHLFNKVIMYVILGAVHKWCHALRGEGGPEIVTICDNGEGGVGGEIVTSHILI